MTANHDPKHLSDLNEENNAVSDCENITTENKTDIPAESAELLYQLPDPDAGKTDEERAAIDRKLVRRIDLFLIPWLALLYLLSFLDRTNVGNARLAGLEDDLGMDVDGSDYNTALSVFFVSYALFEPMSNAILKRVTPRIFFTAIVVIWGLIMTLMGFLSNKSGLIAARLFLGFAEAGLFPGVSYYLSYWYKTSEIGLRIAVFFSAAALAGSFGGLLAAAIAKMDKIGGKPGWAWIFILEGLFTILIGASCWRMVYNWPETAGFLSEDDRIRVRRRLIGDSQGGTAEAFSMRHVKAAFSDWQTYGYMCLNAGSLMPIYAFSLFLPTILGGMGYSGTHAQLLSVPPYALASMVTVTVGYFADKTRQRGFMMMICACVGMTGFAMMLGTGDPTVQYVGTFLAAAGVYPTCPNTLSWTVNNTQGPIKRGIVVGLVVGWANLNGVVASNIYLQRESPRFWTGHGVVLGYQFTFLLCASIVMHFSLRQANKNRRNGKMDAKWEAMSQQEKSLAGDKRPDFVYIT